MNSLSLTGIDVGSPRLAGVTKPLAQGLEITAGGGDIWGTRDEFHFAQQRVTGNFTLSTRLVSLGMADVYTKAGLMLRTSLEAGSAHAYFLAFGDNQPRNKNNGGLEFQYRIEPDGTSIGIYPPQPLSPLPDFPVNFPDVWLRLIRDGDRITGEYSRNGKTWKTFSVHRQPFPQSVLVGLAVTSHHAAQAMRAVFSEIDLRVKA
jgi:hypothetical protein